MYKITLRNLIGAALIGSVLALGCGQQDSNRPKTYPVTGMVTYKGQAVEGATVAYQPTAGKKGATGVTDAAGRYSLTTFTSGDGAVPGQYKVKIVKVKAAEGVAAADQDSEDYVAPTEGQPEVGKSENLLPANYADPNQSGLTATVGEDKNSIDFDLQD
jgi:hypothetical protein